MGLGMPLVAWCCDLLDGALATVLGNTYHTGNVAIPQQLWHRHQNKALKLKFLHLG